MTRPVYSTCFLLKLGATIPVTYIVPAGFTAVLHNMTYWNQATPGSPLIGPAFSVALDDPAAFVWTEEGTGLLVGTYSWSGREVFANILYYANQLPNASFRANGYLLTNP